MIVDTSALIAILLVEPHWEAIREALIEDIGAIPAPALTEFGLVAGGRGREDDARALIANLIEDGLTVVEYTERHALRSWEARSDYGKGNGRGGILNLLDLMVYAVAKESAEPLLCTGKDFSTTDLELHPASRPW